MWKLSWRSVSLAIWFSPLNSAAWGSGSYVEGAEGDLGDEGGRGIILKLHQLPGVKDDGRGLVTMEAG